MVLHKFIKIVLLSGCFFSLNAYSQVAKEAEWKLRKSEEGIQIYTRHTDKAAIDELKIVSVMHCSMSSLVALIIDVDNFPKWIYACKEAKVLQQVNATEQFQYQLINIPSPFSDRDAVIHFTISQDSKTKVVHTHSLAAPSYIPVIEGLVRLPVFDGAYQLTPLPNGDIQVVYNLLIDPGGYIPDWVVNLTLITGPYKSTLSMREELKKPKYAQAKVSFIKD